MSTTRIEGCLWHRLPECDADDADSLMDGRNFLQLMTQRGTNCTYPSPALSSSRQQRYRMVNKKGDEIVCVVSEHDRELHFCIQVVELELFDTLSLMSSWLCACLRDAGHAVYLKVEHVKNHQARGVSDAASSS